MHVTIEDKQARLICWSTVYRIQLQGVLSYIREREVKLSKEPSRVRHLSGTLQP